ncbi:hypothetical protein SDC9_120832 [bioreactor metagenome]|uniref:Uncharacterized protein n=1 Tax=bioreactor metagenome TaxID=1076179 RepID=A0A645CA91_9ZZZZ
MVGHEDRAVGQQRDLDRFAEACQGLINGVVDDLPQAVHQTAGVGRADVHRGAFADGLEPFEDEEVLRLVVTAGSRVQLAITTWWHGSKLTDQPASRTSLNDA